MDRINPFIGTGGFGFGAGSHNPAAQVPHGALRLGPDTAQSMLDGLITVAPSFNHYGGYHFGDNAVTGFSHTHLVGAGVGDYGNFGVLPLRSSLEGHDDDDALLFDSRGRRKALLPLNHSLEQAGPGWYALNVSSPSIRILLAAAGTHSGVHSYAFPVDGGGPVQQHEAQAGTRAARSPRAGTCALSFDACHAAQPSTTWCKNATISVEPAGSSASPVLARVRASVHFAGSLSRRSANGSLAIHFYAEVETSASSPSFAEESSASPRATRLPHYSTPTRGVAILRVPCGGAGVHVRAAISFLSPRQAEANLGIQAPQGTTAAAAKASAELAWQQLLRSSGVRVLDASDASDAERTAFATAVYRTRLAPTIWDEPRGASSRGVAADTNPAAAAAAAAGGGGGGTGVYLGMDGRHRSLGSSAGDNRRHAYTDLSLWDVHRTQLPWLSLTAPAVYSDVVRSLEAMGVEGSGDVPRWPLANIYTGCMIGNHAVAVVAEAIAKGQADRFNASRLYGMLKGAALGPRPHAGREAVEAYLSNGYVPVEANKHSASLTLSYAFDDAGLGKIARHLGRDSEAAAFAKRSAAAFKAGWSVERELMCPRSNASSKLHCPLLPFVPYPGSPHYVEGDALQWLWFVPEDPASLVGLFKSPDRFVARLDDFLQRARDIKSTVLPNPWYWAGNEPDLLAPWLYAFVPGQQYKTASATRWIASHRYRDAPDGLPGNDDYGTLSAWLVWAQLGVYPLAGSDLFVLGSPRFAEVVIGLGGGPASDGSTAEPRQLRIVAHNASAANVYMVRAALNGVAIDLNQPFVKFSDLATGSALLETWMAERAPHE